ncbi:MAG: hypothetical protein K2J39_02150, partial [Ruminococcus sp.]|nr:hypothetical protein [Ruminococcus sp.]
MELIDNSVEIIRKNNSGTYYKLTENDFNVTKGKTIEIRVTGPATNYFKQNTTTTEKLNGTELKSLYAIYIHYKLKFTDEKAAEIDGMGTLQDKDALALKNKAEAKIVGSAVSPAKVESELTITKTSPAPGFGKSAVASFAGRDINANELTINPVGGAITAGDSLIWDLVVYNGNGTAQDNTIAPLELNGMTITEVLPDNYDFTQILSDEVYKLDKSGNYMSIAENNVTVDYSGVSDKLGTFNDKLKTILKPNDYIPDDNKENDAIVTGSTAKADYKNGHIELTGTLEQNQCLVIRILTTVKENQEKDGTISNKAYLTTKETEYRQSVVSAGEVIDNTIWSEAYFSIQMIYTTSEESVNYKDDTGYCFNPTKTYVEGELGKEVTYKLQVDNKSPANEPIHSLVIIDRLPFVDDTELTRGGEVNSAFGVMMGDIKSVKIIDTATGKQKGESITKYTVDYSTDKTTVLTDESKDWIKGQSGSMQWTSSKEGAVDFRIAFDDSVQLSDGESIVVEFTGVVPAYIEDTNEESIAWNTFAYGYQHTVLGKGNVISAAPLKVGVLVKKPDDLFNINITKTLDVEKNLEEKTFYFALFDDYDANNPNIGNRLSDVISVKIPAGYGQQTDMVSMEDVSPSRLQAMYEDIQKRKSEATTPGGTTSPEEETVEQEEIAELGDVVEFEQQVETGGDTEESGDKGTQSEPTTSKKLDKIYVVETDQYGKALKGYTVDYNNSNVISIDTKTTDVDVTVKNTPNVGKITVTKKLTGANPINDTFYFALYTIEGKNYVRYEDAGVMSIPIDPTKKIDGSNEFNNVPVGIDFYVLECNPDGTLENNSTEDGQGKYTSENGINYKVTYENNNNKVNLESANATANVSITNEKQIEYSITVSKNLVLEDTDKLKNTNNLTGEFTVGLFEKIKKEDNKGNSDETLNVYSEDSETVTDSESGDDKIQLIKTITVSAGDSTTFTGLPAGDYYVYELDEKGDAIINRDDKGNIITNSSEHTFTLWDKTDIKKPQQPLLLKTTYIGAGSEAITLSENNPTASAVITNTNVDPMQIRVTKTAIKDNKLEDGHKIQVGLFTLDNGDKPEENPYYPYKLVEFPEVNGEQKESIKTMTTGKDGTNGKDTTSFNGLTPGIRYYVFELRNGNPNDRALNGETVEVGKEPKTYVATYTNTSVVLDGNIPGSVAITDTYTDKNDIILQFRKLDVNGDLFSGAELSITGDISESVSYNTTGIFGEDKTSTPDNATDKNEKPIVEETDKRSITWTTDGEHNLYVKGLKKGTYTLAENSNVYADLNVTFTVDSNGYIDTSTIVVNDKTIPATGVQSTATSLTVTNRSEMSISKTDIDDEHNTPIAEAKISIELDAKNPLNNNTFLNPDYIELVKVETKTNTKPTDSESTNDTELADDKTTTYTKIIPEEITSKKITFTSQGESIKIIGLPNGTYILTEETAPSGYA